MKLEKLFNINDGASALSVIAMVSIAGCLNIGKTYSEINPDKAKIETRSHNGDAELKNLPVGTTRVIFRSEGEPMAVTFRANPSSDSCQPFKELGTVADVGRGILLPFVANSVAMTNKMSGKKEFIVLDPEPGKPIQISGYGSWISSTKTMQSTLLSAGSCGPLLRQFTPVADHAYVVKWLWIEQSKCIMDITDETNSDLPQQVESVDVHACSK